MNQFEILVFGSALHDVGKFVQRASWGAKKDHKTHGKEFLDNTRFVELSIFAEYHHKRELDTYKGDNLTKNLLKIVCEADNISSKEREESEVEYGSPLKSVFSSVKLNNKESAPMHYRPAILKLNQINYPEKITAVTESDYRAVFSEFEEEIKKLKNNPNAEKLFTVLEKYTTFIPAKMSLENDISLFDHLKTTAAIASCLYHYHIEELNGNPDIENKTEKKYLLVGGDISGIQSFIYTVTSKGALKYLRARSAFLEFLTYDVAFEIVDRCKLTSANILYAGGGHFLLLVPNTEKSKQIILDVKREVNERLYNSHSAELYFVIDFIETNGSSLMNMQDGQESLWDKIHNKLDFGKKKKFLELSENRDKWWLISEHENKCQICGRRESELKVIEEKKIEACTSCSNLWTLAEEILKARYFVRTKEVVLDKYFDLPFSKIHLCRKDFEMAVFPEKDSIIFVKNSFELLNFPHKQIPILISEFASKVGGVVKSFNDFEGIGAKKIALLKMDVDNLGKIFNEGLERNTISRTSMLSRMLNLFFKGHIDTLIETDTEYTPKLSNKHGKDRDVVVIYAGGDDLMIAGSWNDVFELSFHIRESFRRYTADNPGITISAGYGIFDEKTPVKRMADLVSDRLEISKEEGRNRIFMLERGIQATNGTVFSKSYEWDKFLEIWNRISDIYSLNGEPKLKISKSLIWKILEAREVYLRDQKSVYWFITPMYHLSRADKDKKIKAGRIFSFLFKINPEDEVQEIYHVDVPLKIMDLATRRGGG